MKTDEKYMSLSLWGDSWLGDKEIWISKGFDGNYQSYDKEHSKLAKQSIQRGGVDIEKYCENSGSYKDCVVNHCVKVGNNISSVAAKNCWG